MIEVKLHKNEIEKIVRAIESSRYFGNDKPLCNRIIAKMDKALKTTQSTECIKSDVGQSFGRCIDFEIDDESGACPSQCDFCKKLPQ